MSGFSEKPPGGLLIKSDQSISQSPIINTAVTSVLYQPQSGNGVAHELARFGLTEGATFVWEDVALPWLESSLARDMELG
ncbi:hypothetical protein L3X38_022770 [Prunus dulcis]|uniref:Uncharacterized protein n=1 Tax=Prunus dulcis TaxID=3755 RepID=A0AAD4VZ53_PRUDU|nr:hypothetical protein L3X38_022770 [Prunus dulcis]